MKKAELGEFGGGGGGGGLGEALGSAISSYFVVPKHFTYQLL